MKKKRHILRKSVLFVLWGLLFFGIFLSGHKIVDAQCGDLCYIDCPGQPCETVQDCRLFPFGQCCGTICSSSCFPAGTQVLMADETEKNIEEVVVGDKVVSQAESGERTVATVTELDQPVRDHMCRINYTNGESLELTNEHPLFTQNGWRAIDPSKTYEENPNLPVTQIQKGDKVVKADGSSAEVDDFACWSQRQQTYNLILDNGPNTYFANGYLAHNKGGEWYCPSGTTLVYEEPTRYLERCYTPCYEVCSDYTGKCWTDCDPEICRSLTCTAHKTTCSPPAGAVAIGWPDTVAGAPAGCLVTNYSCGDESGLGCAACACVPSCGSPAAPTLTSPDNGGTVIAITSNLSWTHDGNWGEGCGEGAKTFKVYADTNPNPTTLIGTVPEGVNSLEFTGNDDTLYYWKVAAHNGTNETPSGVRSFTISRPTIAGTVYRVTGPGECSGTGLGPVQPGATSYVRASGYLGPVSGAVAGNGTYGVTDVADGINAVVLNPSDPLWVDPCGTWTRSVNVTGNMAEDFYVTDVQYGWFATRGGDVGANGGDVVTRIPITCSLPTCLPYLSAYDSSGTVGSSGVLWFASGIGNNRYGDRTSEGTDWGANSSVRTTTRREGYDYFYRIFELGLRPTEDPQLAGFNETNMAKPTDSEANAYAYYVKAGDGSDKVTIGTPWDLDPGESVVVFVEGNLEVAAPTVVATDNEFLAFVVSGDITFTLGNAVPDINHPNVQGIFIADGQIITSASNEQFVGEGVFVGWGGVELNRDFGDATNNTNPSEFFSYRPDFVLNAPARIRRPVMRWEEVAP